MALRTDNDDRNCSQCGAYFTGEKWHCDSCGRSTCLKCHPKPLRTALCGLLYDCCQCLQTTNDLAANEINEDKFSFDCSLTELQEAAVSIEYVRFHNSNFFMRVIPDTWAATLVQFGLLERNNQQFHEWVTRMDTTVEQSKAIIVAWLVQQEANREQTDMFPSPTSDKVLSSSPNTFPPMQVGLGPESKQPAESKIESKSDADNEAPDSPMQNSKQLTAVNLVDAAIRYIHVKHSETEQEHDVGMLPNECIGVLQDRACRKFQEDNHGAPRITFAGDLLHPWATVAELELEDGATCRLLPVDDAQLAAEADNEPWQKWQVRGEELWVIWQDQCQSRKCCWWLLSIPMTSAAIFATAVIRLYIAAADHTPGLL